MLCPACLLETENVEGLAEHLHLEAGNSSSDHVMFLNRYVGREELGIEDLEARLSQIFLMENGFRNWVIKIFIQRFYGKDPHPFVLENQDPKPYLIRGYAMEHHHFLWQWVRSCSYIIGNSDNDDVVQYECENIVSEWYGTEKTPSHHELLLRMGEAYGLDRNDILKSVPLPATERATKFWSHVCRERSWQEGMSAMHTLELIANRKITEYGGKVGYFDPRIMGDDRIKSEAKEFLKEGYLADVSHSERALMIIEKYSDRDMLERCQSVILRSMEYFYDYLLARIERGLKLENKQ